MNRPRKNFISSETATYLKVYFALLGLLAASIVSSHTLRFFLNEPAPWIGTLLSLSISVVKTVLILAFFMHLKHARTVTRWVAVAAYLWVFLFFLLALNDYLTRAPSTL